jgi:hypothetical protein
MDILSEFNKLHLSLKALLVSIAFILPFMYLSEFFLFRHFFIENNIYMPIILSFCLTVCYFFINMIATILFVKLSSTTEEDNLIGAFALTTFVSIVWISVILIFAYTTNRNFIFFIKTVFIISTLHILFFFFLSLLKKCRNKRSKAM